MCKSLFANNHKKKKKFGSDKKRLLANSRLLDYFIPVRYLFLRNCKNKQVETPVKCCKNTDGKKCKFSSRKFKTVKTAALDIVFLNMFLGFTKQKK